MYTMTVRILDFHADWCGPCKTQDPILEDLLESLEEDGYTVDEFDLGPDEDIDDLADSTDVSLVKVDVDENVDFSHKHEVQSIPTLVVLTEDGDISERFIGVQQEPSLREAVDGAL